MISSSESAETSAERVDPAYVVGGVRIDALTMADAVERVVNPNGSRAVHLCNAYTVALASRDAALTERLNRGQLNLPDGMPLIWIARRLGLGHMTGRVYGPGLMAACLDRGRDVGTRHFLYGSTGNVLDTLRTQIDARWPGADIVGMESPPFRDLTDEEVAAAVERTEAAGADIVWVGLGTPKQDVVVDRMQAVGSCTFVAIGAAFDFIAGTKRQAPKWMQDHGLEWLFRLMSEPRRLWKRYLVGNTRFIAVCLRRRPHMARQVDSA